MSAKLTDRIAVLEKQVANLMANHRASPVTLLVGWFEISRYCRKRPRTLSRYAKGLAFPAYRWGRYVVSSPFAIDDWLRAVAAVRKRSKDGRQSG